MSDSSEWIPPATYQGLKFSGQIREIRGENYYSYTEQGNWGERGFKISESVLRARTAEQEAAEIARKREIQFAHSTASFAKEAAAKAAIETVVVEPAVEPAPTSASDLVLQARLSGLESSVADQLQLFAEGKITQEEFVSRKDVIEEAHLDWYMGFEKTGATPEETKTFIEARGGESAAQLESTVKQILTMEATGEITHEQSVATVEHYQEKQLEEVQGILSGEDVHAEESGLSIDYRFVDKTVPDTGPVNVNEMLKPAVSVPVDINAMLEEVMPVEESKPIDLLDTAVSVASASPRLVDLGQMQREREFTVLEPIVTASVAGGSTKPVEPELFTHTQVASGMVTHHGIEMSRDQFEADFGGTPDSDVIPYSPVKPDVVLPSPEDFVGIPGPASARKPGSLGEKIQTIVDEKIAAFEEGVVSFEMGTRQAGRQLGAEAQIALEEGNVGEALILGMSAFSARAGVGIVEGATFLVRPLAWQKAAGGLVEGAKGVLEAPEEIPGGLRKWAGQVARDPGSIVEFAGDIAAGFAISEVISTLSGPTHKVSRVEAIDIDVKSTTLGLVDEVDPFSGKSVKVIQFPEVDITPTVTRKRIPKVVSELMEEC